MTHGTMQDDRGGWRRTVWYDSAGRKHASLSVPRRRWDVLDMLTFAAIAIATGCGVVAALTQTLN